MIGRPRALKVDALVGTPQPTVSWAANDSRRGEAQSAYEIRLFDVSTGRKRVWDSAKFCRFVHHAER